VQKSVAKVAVSAATYQIDKPYDYLVPENLADSLLPGMRVLVPFSKGNRKTEGIVLDISGSSEYEKLKCISSILDDTPVISEELLKLALWMRERFFCTVYDAVKAMLPAGIWYKLRSVCRIAEDTGREDAYAAAGHSEKQRRVLDIVFAHGGSCEFRDIELAFGEEDPLSAIHALTVKGVMATDSLEKRRIKDKTIGFAALDIPADEASQVSAAAKT